ncbi:CLUMA_CG004221, isoform A [Clunio marinus]|uniref:CLUMA_CG004221, isoform A n=1 Tax=Clunio marinus TaxID=568069 RepID=A0A1J1HQU4_9DIPT|nr:CLUMA_CG004221, isoform A [Clunio marinus]
MTSFRFKQVKLKLVIKVDFEATNLFIHHSSSFSINCFLIKALKQKLPNRTIYCHVLQLFKASQAMYNEMACICKIL